MPIEFNHSHLHNCLLLGYKYFEYKGCKDFGILKPIKCSAQLEVHNTNNHYHIPIMDEQVFQMASGNVDLIPDFKFYIKY